MHLRVKNYRGLIMKVAKRALASMIREVVAIDTVQMDFVPSRSTNNSVQVVSQLQVMVLGKKKQLYFVFVDLDRVFQEMV